MLKKKNNVSISGLNAPGLCLQLAVILCILSFQFLGQWFTLTTILWWIWGKFLFFHFFIRLGTTTSMLFTYRSRNYNVYMNFRNSFSIYAKKPLGCRQRLYWIHHRLLWIVLLSFFFKKLLIYFRKGTEGGERNTCGCLLHAPYWGLACNPGICLRLGIKLATLLFAGQRSIRWATPARAILLS